MMRCHVRVILVGLMAVLVAVTPAVAADPTEPPVTKAVGTAAAPLAAQPAVKLKSTTTLAIDIDLTHQHMTVIENGHQVGSWPISSGREGYRSPTGSFHPLWSSRMWYSKKYDNAPMPNAVFFSGGVAMHATQATGMLGHSASHGCIRQSPVNAAMTYRLVEKHGNAHTKITVHGTPHDDEPRVARAVPRDGEQGATWFSVRRSSQSASSDRAVGMRRVILVDGNGNRRVAEIPANDPRILAREHHALALSLFGWND